MKHKIVASNLSAFNVMFDDFLKRCEEVGEKIAKAQFNWDNDLHKGYRAKVWTKRESEVTK